MNWPALSCLDAAPSPFRELSRGTAFCLAVLGRLSWLVDEGKPLGGQEGNTSGFRVESDRWEPQEAGAASCNYCIGREPHRCRIVDRRRFRGCLGMTDVV